jgi:hypothetical protein
MIEFRLDPDRHVVADRRTKLEMPKSLRFFGRQGVRSRDLREHVAERRRVIPRVPIAHVPSRWRAQSPQTPHHGRFREKLQKRLMRNFQAFGFAARPMNRRIGIVQALNTIQVKAPPLDVFCDMLRSHEVNRPSIVMARIRKRPMNSLRGYRHA